MRMQQLYESTRRAFSAYSAQMQVTGENVANAETPGYARRRLTLKPDALGRPGVQMRPHTPVGGGVTVDRYERMRDGLLERAAYEAQAGLGGADEEARLLGAIEGVLGAGAGSAITDAMDGFWNAWTDLADNPTDPGVRQTVLTEAEAVADALRGIDSDLARIGREAQDALADGVGQANALLAEVADLNVAVRSARAAGSPDLAAEDRRDQALGELAAFLPIEVTEEADGYAVTVGGMAVVQGDAVTPLRYVGPPDAAAPAVAFGGTGVAYRDDAGRIGGWLRTVNESLPETRAALDAFAERLVTDVNAAHAAGFGLDGSTGLDFFDPAGMGAGSLRVALDDPAALAAAGAPDAPGDSTAALAVGALREGFDAEAIALSTGVGARLRSARTDAAAHGAVADHLQAMARGVSGVSLDEEMTKLIETQQAFAASARVLATAEEMMDTILAL